MELKPISDAFAVSPQIVAGDLAAIKQAGFQGIICNRPDREGADQPLFSELQAAAGAVGIAMRYVPVTPGQVGDDDVTAFAAALDDLPSPVLAYCRTGTRSAMLWSFHASKDRPVPDILAATQAAGYDMSGIAQRIANGGKNPRP